MSAPTLDRGAVEPLHDIEEMTVAQHHQLCLGVLAMCYQHVPDHLQLAIIEGLTAAKKMGSPIEPSNILTGLPLAMNQ